MYRSIGRAPDAGALACQEHRRRCSGDTGTDDDDVVGHVDPLHTPPYAVAASNAGAEERLRMLVER